MTLTTDQQQAATEILESVEKGENHVLMGFAGTGKTYLTQYLGNALRDKNCAFVAPTNKAVKVLQENMPRHYCMTIHKMLNLRLEKGKLKQTEYPNLERYDIIFVDESSMINLEIYKLLFENVVNGTVPVVFIGDPAQLPPIGEKLSVVFETENKSTLNEIVRQAKTNSIIPFSKTIREVGFRPHRIPIDNKNLFQRPAHKKFKYAEDMLVKGHTVYTAWTNKAVNEMNFHIHDHIYGREAPDFEVGERIVMGEPFIHPISGEILANNGDEFIVKAVRQQQKGEYECLMIDVDQGAMPLCLPVPTRAGQIKYLSHLQDYKDTKQWGPYFGLKERYADVRHTYAYTCHKLQGTTVKNIMIDVPNIMRNRKDSERDKMMYVAVTRASNKVLFFN